MRAPCGLGFAPLGGRLHPSPSNQPHSAPLSAGRMQRRVLPACRLCRLWLDPRPAAGCRRTVGRCPPNSALGSGPHFGFDPY
eukprot:3048183-Prymnesium_polylepis.1